MTKLINKISRRVAIISGGSAAIFIAFLFVFAWVIGGFFIGFTNANYGLLINTVANTVGFLMLFLIQSSQNTDTLAIQLKLDELIRTNTEARNHLIGIEDREGISPDEIKELQHEFSEVEKEEIKTQT